MSDEDVHRGSPGFAALSQTVLSDDANLRDALRRVAETGCGLLAHCIGASVTLVELGRPITVGSTNDTAEALDGAQYSAREGPCLTAAEERRVVRIDDIEHDERWPRFSASARANGVRSSLSLPLVLAGDNMFGVFNIYGKVVAGFTDHDEQLCQGFAAQASIVVSNAQAYWAAFELSENLTKAMQTRAAIEQAKGALMSTHRIDADAAFEMLRQRSQRSNRKLHDVAADVLSETTEGDGDGSPRS
jgi:GAF domain-containing protein